MPTLVINGKRVKVGDEFLSLPQEEQHKAIDEIAGKLNLSSGAPSVTAPAANEGMPSPRGDAVDRALGAGWSALTGGRNLQSDLESLRDVTAPPSISDVGGNIALEARRAADFAKAGGQNAIDNFKAGRPASAVLGGLQQLVGGAGIVLSPVSGVIRSYVGDPLSRFFGEDVGEKANLVANALATPGGLTAAAKPVTVVGNLGARGADVIETLANPKLNSLITATGGKGEEIANALRASTSGVEGAGQAASPVGSVPFTKFTRAVGEHASDTVKDAARLQDQLLAARSNMAEGRMAEGSRKLADAVAEPNQQQIGDKLIDIANKEKKTSRQTVTSPAYDAFVDATEGQGTDISNVVGKANDLIDTIDQDAAKVLSRRLGKFTGETTTPETFVPLADGGGYSVEGAPITKPPMATAEDLNDIRSAINDAIGVAKKNNAEADLRRLNQLHNEVNSAVMNSTTFSDEAKAAWENANKTYAEQHIPRFKTGLQQNLFKTRGNETAIASEDVVPKFMAGPTEVDQFVALFGKNPEAMDYARQGVEGMFRDAAIKNGVIDTAKANDFLKRYGAQIDALDAQGLNIRNKLNTLISETDRATAPASNIAETRRAVGTENIPSGPTKAAAQQQVESLVNAATPEELSSLRDAVEIARRRVETNNLAAGSTETKLGVPVVPTKAPSFLSLKLRAAAGVFKQLAGRLNDKTSRELGELFNDPSRLNEAADLIDKALAMQAKKGRNVAPNYVAPKGTAAFPVINALAPPNQNSLAGR